MAAGYEITFTRHAAENLEGFDRRDRNLILDRIKEQLRYQPQVATRNRKLLRESPLADWELRVERFRVFYEIDDEAQSVKVLAIGEKRRERLFIGSREFKL